MNQQAPVSDIMTKDVITVSIEDTLLDVKHAFDNKKIHHVPVVNDGKLVGIISRSDLAKISGGLGTASSAAAAEEFYASISVESKMTEKIAKVGPNERIDVVALIFHENRFHALPVVDGETLVGIVTTHDLIGYAYELIQKAWKK